MKTRYSNPNLCRLQYTKYKYHGVAMSDATVGNNNRQLSVESHAISITNYRYQLIVMFKVTYSILFRMLEARFLVESTDY